jgi:transcriptional regulator with XRE-family HTH domain
MTRRETPGTLRRAKKIEATTVAERMGTAKGNVSNYENGKLVASDDFIRRWANAVGVGFKAAYCAHWEVVLSRALATTREARKRLADTRCRGKAAGSLR